MLTEFCVLRGSNKECEESRFTVREFQSNKECRDMEVRFGKPINFFKPNNYYVSKGDGTNIFNEYTFSEFHSKFDVI